MKISLLRWVLIPVCCGVVSWWLSTRTMTPPPSPAMNLESPVAEISERSEVGTLLASWRLAQSEGDAVKRVAKIWEASLPMTAEAFAAALEEALTESDQSMILALGEAWAQSDAVAMVRWLEEREAFPESRQLMKAAYAAWVRDDAEAAFENLLSGDGRRDTRLVEKVCLPYLSKYPEELASVFAAMSSFTTSRFEMRQMTGFVMRRYQPDSSYTGDGALLAKGFHALPEGHGAEVFAQMIGQAILTEAPSEDGNQRFWDWWQALPSSLQGNALPDISESLSEVVKAPAAARALVAQLAQTDKDVVPAYMHFWGEDWAVEGPHEARDWVLEAYEGEFLPGMSSSLSGSLHMTEVGSREADDFGRALAPVFSSLAGQDPQEAIVSLDEVPHLEVRAQMAREVAQTWATTAPLDALEWAAQQPSSRLRYQAGSSALKGWAETDLEAATVHAVQMEEFEYGGSPLGTLSDVVESQGPEASSAWLASLPEEAIDRTLAHLISNPPQIDRLRPFQSALEDLPASPGKAYITELIEQRVQGME